VAARMIAIVRTERTGEAVAAIRALAAAGVTVAEISLATTGALAALERAAAGTGGQGGQGGQLILGAGTVRSVGAAEQAVAAGARFLVSPGLNPDVVDWARERDLLHLPGVFTPTELDDALARGARLIKLFPAGRLGPGYVRDLLAPFPQAQLVTTGGITPSNAQAYLDAGAVAVAVGSALVNPATMADPDRLADMVREFHALVRS
jgi:2-dehydro-3-deoxyphosphogluconate aldolase / (4S)-4-hydroxy-2-oxoglutarate aldolase